MTFSDSLSARAVALADRIAAGAARHGVAAGQLPSGTRLLDFGVRAPGSDTAGIALAELSLGGRAAVGLEAGSLGGSPVQVVRVSADEPWLPCLGSQYAGWRVTA